LFYSLCTDTISVVIEYAERPSERDYPLDGGLYIIQESIDFPLNQFEILCYNLESNNANDTEITFANPNITNQNFDHIENNFAALNLGTYPTSFNGNVTCRSQATGKASTVYIASRQFNFLYFICIYINDRIPMYSAYAKNYKCNYLPTATRIALHYVLLTLLTLI